MRILAWGVWAATLAALFLWIVVSLWGCGDDLDGYSYPEICDQLGDQVEATLERCGEPCPPEIINCNFGAWLACRFDCDASDLRDLITCLHELESVSCPDLAVRQNLEVCQSLIGDL